MQLERYSVDGIALTEQTNGDGQRGMRPPPYAAAHVRG